MTSWQKTGAHPFYIGMYIHIYTHIYVHKYTSQKECLHIFSVTSSTLTRATILSGSQSPCPTKIFYPRCLFRTLPIQPHVFLVLSHSQNSSSLKTSPIRSIFSRTVEPCFSSLDIIIIIMMIIIIIIIIMRFIILYI